MAAPTIVSVDNVSKTFVLNRHKSIKERLVATYAELPPDGVGALYGSTDHLELAAPSSSAAERLGLARGAAVTVSKI